MNTIPASRRSGSSAFTLIETLVAIAIIAAVLPILMSGISLATRAATLAKQRSLATSLAPLMTFAAVLPRIVASGACKPKP